MTFKLRFFFPLPLLLLIQCSSKEIRKEAVPESEIIFAPESPKIPQPVEAEKVAEVAEKTGGLKTQPPVIRKNPKKQRGRFQFSGDEFVKEKGNNPFEKKTDTLIRLRGHAKVASKNLKMSSPQIEIYGDDGHMAYAKGPVEIVDTRNATRITADEALFIRGENRAILRGNARLVAIVKNKKKKSEKINLSSQELERNFDTSVSVARGKVVVTNMNAVLYANSAEFIEPLDQLRSDASPRIFSGSDLFLADVIQWDIGRNTADFHGHVKAYFSRPEETKKKQAVDSAVRSEEGTLVQHESLPFGQKLTLRKKVVFERKTYSAYSEEAEVFGPGGEVVKAHDHVVLINREENSKSYGDTFEWVKATGYMTLSARKNSQTRTLMLNKKDIPTAEIIAATVTRANSDAHPQARGNVKIVQFSRDTTAPPVKMGAEWAEIRRAEKLIQLNGSPYIEGQMGRIGAKDIILYYEEQRYEMLGILPGVVEQRLNE